MHIERTRYIIRRKSDNAIMCGLARCFQFKKESEIGNTAIKTYVSEKKALQRRGQICRKMGKYDGAGNGKREATD